MPNEVMDLVGQKFGRLTVVSQAPHIEGATGRRVIAWRCVCACGGHKDVRATSLRNGTTQSCGCKSKSITRSDWAEYFDDTTDMTNQLMDLKSNVEDGY